MQKLERLAEKGETRARALGLEEEDVPRLVEEVRRAAPLGTRITLNKEIQDV